MGLKDAVEALRFTLSAGESHGDLERGSLLDRAALASDADGRALDAVQIRLQNIINPLRAVNSILTAAGGNPVTLSDEENRLVGQIEEAEEILRRRIFYREVVADAREAGVPDIAIVASFELGRLRTRLRR